MIVVWRLVLSGTVMLVVELALIRWLGANLVYLSYFSNFVLLGSFLGIGLGFLRAAGRGGPDLTDADRSRGSRHPRPRLPGSRPPEPIPNQPAPDAESASGECSS